MMPDAGAAYSGKTREFSMARTLEPFLAICAAAANGCGRAS